MQITQKISLTLTWLAVLSLGAACAHATGLELITNGGFETGDFTGWSANAQAGSSGSLTIQSGKNGPISHQSNAGPASGQFFALTDGANSGTYSLEQNFTVIPGSLATFSFGLFVNDYSGKVTTPPTLDYTQFPNQQVRVDLLNAGAGPFSVAPADVLKTFYDGADPNAANPNPYTHYSFDISNLVAAGGTYTIRFAEVDNQGFLNMGVDNVSVTSAPVPETSTILSLGLLLGMGGLALAARRRQAAS